LQNFAMEFNPTSQQFTQRMLSQPRLEPGDVLVDVVCCSLCGSDLHSFAGRRSTPERCVLGHEIIGTIAAWGPGSAAVDYHGRKLSLGQRVTWSMVVGCGACFFCQNQLTQKCMTLFKYGHEAGEEGNSTGGLSTQCVLVTGTPIFPIPEQLSDEVVSPANCATATVSAAMRLILQTHQVKGATVLIVGAGMLGLTAAAQLSEAGADQILVVDPAKKRLQLARKFGATDTLGLTDQSAVETATSKLSAGRGVDLALDFAGAPQAVEACIRSVRVGGCVLLVGSVFPSREIAIAPEQLVRRMLTIRGLHNYLPEDLDHALQFLSRSNEHFPFQELAEKSFPLSQTQAAFRYFSEHRPIRVLVRP
jgi:putative phosphonate catabolism associated alcohol dehydrogenase